VCRVDLRAGCGDHGVVTEPLPPALGCDSRVSWDVVIAAQAKAIEELRAANTGLVERVTALERVVGRDSGNSSMPPSSDDLPGRKKPPPRPVDRIGSQAGFRTRSASITARGRDPGRDRSSCVRPRW